MSSSPAKSLLCNDRGLVNDLCKLLASYPQFTTSLVRELSFGNGWLEAYDWFQSVCETIYKAEEGCGDLVHRTKEGHYVIYKSDTL